MVEPLGEEFIRIRPDASTFRAELQAQISAALPGAQAQAAAAQAQIARAAAAPRERITAGGIVLPSAIRDVENLGVRLRATDTQLRALGTTQRRVVSAQRELADSTRAGIAATQSFQRNVDAAERSTGRYARGMVAATAASTGFFRAVSFASGAFLLGAAVGATIGAATNEFVEMTRVGAQTAAILRATGEAANVTAEQIDALGKRQLALTGIDDELVKGAANVLLTFRQIRNAGDGMNAVFDRSVEAALDISNVLGTNLRSTAIQVGKALQDPIRGVTALRRSGITLTASQRELIKSLAESGQVLTAQKIILGEIERQVGGTAEAIGRTLPGRLRAAREETVNALGEMVGRISESRQAAELAAQGTELLNAAWTVLRETVTTVGPPLLEIVQGFERVTQAAGGAQAVIAGVAAFTAFRIATRAATTATGLFTAASAGAARASLVQATASGVATVQLQRQATAEVAAAAAAQRSFTIFTALAGVMAASAAVSGQYAIAAGLAGVAVVGLAGKAIAAVRSLQAAGQAVSALRVASLALGGPVGIAAAAVTALGIGMFILSRRAQNAAGSVTGFKRALDDLNASVAGGQRNLNAIAAQSEKISEARLSEQQATRDLAQAQQALNQSRAEPGSLQNLALEDRLAVARDRLTQATRDRRQAEAALGVLQAQQDRREQQRGGLIANTTRRVLDQVSALQRQQRIVTIRGIPVGIRPNPQVLSATEQLRRFLEVTRELGRSDQPIESRTGRALQTLANTINRLPSRKQIEIVVNLAGRGLTVGGILGELGIGLSRARAQAEQELESLRGDRLALETDTNTLLQEQERAANALLEAETKRVKAARDRRNDMERELATQREALRSAQEARRNAQEALVAARQSLIDTIRSSREAVNQAVNDAKQNLRSIADSVADALGRISDAGGGEVSAALARRFRELRDQIIRGEGGPDTRRAAQRVAALAQAQRAEAGEDTTDRARRRLADLTDQFNRGQISVREFNRRLDRVIKDFKFDSAGFAREFGTAARNELLDQITALRRQAVALAEGPQQPGGGTAPNIVSTVRAVAQANRDIADAQRGVQTAIRNLRETERALSQAQLDESKAQTRLTRQQVRLQQRLNEKMDAQNALIRVQNRRTKPTGGAAVESDRITRSVGPGGR